jgi:hypothetical protein
MSGQPREFHALEQANMSNRLTAIDTVAAAFFRLIPISLLLFLAGCGGSSSSSHPPSSPPSAPPTSGIQATNFGVQCGIGVPIYGQINCYGNGTILWPATQAQQPQPTIGLLRLHDAGTYWSDLNPSSGTYDFTNLDAWLDVIAQHEPVAVSQVFTWVPCWDSTGTCGVEPVAKTGSNGIPIDLTTNGSPAFNDFVTAFVQHCSPAGNCVKNIIQYYEMWNEWNLPIHWTNCGSTMAQCAQALYQMLAPAAQIIKANVPNAVIFTPSTTPESSTYQCDFLTWLDLENTSGRISDWVTWHVYLTTPSGSSTNLPETQWSNYNQNFLNIQAGGSAPGCSEPATTQWASIPWANTETNFSGSTIVDYQCPPIYSAEDCTGQIVRWQILHDSNGASGLFWYYWLDTIGSNPQYETAYYYMMQYMLGGKYTAAASSSDGGTTWSAPFTESNGTVATWAWTTNEAGTSYSVPSGVVDYKDLSGNTHTAATGQQITLSTEPYLFEQ